MKIKKFIKVFNNYRKPEDKFFIGLLIVCCLLLFLFAKTHGYTLLGLTSVKQPTPTSEILMLTPTPAFSPTETPTVYYPSPTIDPDPVITCNSSYSKCLGQSIKIKQSECPNITC